MVWCVLVLQPCCVMSSYKLYITNKHTHTPTHTQQCCNPLLSLYSTNCFFFPLLMQSGGILFSIEIQFTIHSGLTGAITLESWKLTWTDPTSWQFHRAPWSHGLGQRGELHFCTFIKRDKAAEATSPPSSPSRPVRHHTLMPRAFMSVSRNKAHGL